MRHGCGLRNNNAQMCGQEGETRGETLGFSVSFTTIQDSAFLSPQTSPILITSVYGWVNSYSIAAILVGLGRKGSGNRRKASECGSDWHVKPPIYSVWSGLVAIPTLDAAPNQEVVSAESWTVWEGSASQLSHTVLLYPQNTWIPLFLLGSPAHSIIQYSYSTQSYSTSGSPADILIPTWKSHPLDLVN